MNDAVTNSEEVELKKTSPSFSSGGVTVQSGFTIYGWQWPGPGDWGLVSMGSFLFFLFYFLTSTLKNLELGTGLERETGLEIGLGRSVQVEG